MRSHSRAASSLPFLARCAFLSLLVLGAPWAKAEIKLDLSFVERDSEAYSRFKSWVDAAANGEPGYAFSATDAALLFRLSDIDRHCELAVEWVERQVTDAEAKIAQGERPEIAGDSYLHVGPMISDLALTWDACAERLTDAQKTRWSAYAEQSVWNVWHHVRANWGGVPQPWTGWSTDNPGNNYYYSFLEATMLWALASKNEGWMTELREKRLPPLQAYFAKLPGGGSREGTGYGAAHMRLFWLYRLWRDATGENLADASPHAGDSIAYWVHATVPTLDRFAPIGDQSRNSMPEIYDYHRRLVLEARQVTIDPQQRAMASWWLHNISLPQMSSAFNFRHDLLPAGDASTAPEALLYHARGTGHLFARTGWDKDAMWVAVVAGHYDESHAHQDQGGFTLFARDWLAVTENVWTHSGIQQGSEVHNVVRFERDDKSIRQCQSPDKDRIVHQCYPTKVDMKVTPGTTHGAFNASVDLTPAYRDNPALTAWQREFGFADRRLTVRDRFELGAGTQAIFQVNTPKRPKINGREAIAGRLRIRVIEPENATLEAHDWHEVDAKEFRRGWRLDVRGGETGYVVELDEAPAAEKP